MQHRIPILLFLLLACFGWSQAQYNVTVQGTLVDQVTGAPVANHPVYIEYDSTQTWYHYGSVTTDAAGFYSDVATGVPYTSGNIRVSTYDCASQHQVLANYTCSSTNNFFNGLDSICAPNPANCQAMFASTNGSNGWVYFSWQSTTGSPFVGFSSRSWNFGDGTTSTAWSPNHQYTANGTYNVCLTITTSAGCTSTHCATVTVGNTVGTCNANFTRTNLGNGTWSFTNTSTASAGIASSYWTFGDGGNSTATSPTHTYAAPGTYTVTLHITANGGSCTDSQSYAVTVSGPCLANQAIYNSGNPMKYYFYNSSYVPSGSSITSMQWNFGDGNTAPGMSGWPSVEHTYAAVGTYVVCLTITTNIGCVSTTCDTIVIGNGGTCVSSFSSYSTGGCNIHFSDSSFANAGIASYFWDFGDGNTSTSSNPNHSYASSGYRVVCLTITANDACTSTFCDSVYCNLPGSCSAYFTSQFSPGSQSNVVFTNMSAGSGVVSNWSFGDGQYSGASNPSHNYTANGTYVVCLNISANGGGCTDSYCDTIVINNAASSCNANFSSSYQGGGQFAFTNSSTASAGVLNYYWDFGDGSNSNATNPTHTYSAPGTYVVSLYLYANNGCTDSLYQTVTYGAPTCQASFLASAGGGNPLEYNFWSTSTLSPNTYITSMSWSFGDGSTSTSSQVASHTYASTGSFVVCLSIVTNTGCTSTWCDTLLIGGGNSCIAGFVPSYISGCDFSFQDSSYAAAGIASYFWDFGDGTTSTLANPTHSYSSSGGYPVCLTIWANDSCSSTYCDSVYCSGSPVCQAAYTWMIDTSGQYTILLYEQSTGSSLSYFWDFGDGATSTQQYPDHVYAGAGYYAVCLTVTNGFGCNSTYCDTLAVLFRLGVPFSINVVSPVTAVTPSAPALGMTLHPNPAQQEVRLSIEVGQQGEGHVRLIDVQGRTAQTVALGQLSTGLHQQSLDLSQLSQGIYMVELLVDGQRQVQKLVVTK